MKAIGQINNMDNLLPELPESPYLIRKNEKRAQRVHHSKIKIAEYRCKKKYNTFGGS